jgi:hypothetical protein
LSATLIKRITLNSVFATLGVQSNDFKQ